MTSVLEAYRRALFVPVMPVVWLVLSVFGVVAGPFGTLSALSLGARLIYWPLVVAVGILIGAALRVVVRDLLGLRRYTVEAPMLAVLAMLVLAPPLTALTGWMIDIDGADRPDFEQVALYVLVASLATTTLRYAMMQMYPAPAVRDLPGPVPAPAGEGAGDVALPRLQARLDPDLRAPILRLQVRDHYVDVITEAGTASLLMRFADAIAELEGQAGLQVHRSHWVAADAVVAAQRLRGKLMLRTRDGAEVPVSRTYQAQVIKHGLLAAE